MADIPKFRCDNCNLLLAIGENGTWSVAHAFSVRVGAIDEWIPILPGQSMTVLKRISVKCICGAIKGFQPNHKG